MFTFKSGRGQTFEHPCAEVVMMRAQENHWKYIEEDWEPKRVEETQRLLGSILDVELKIERGKLHYSPVLYSPPLLHAVLRYMRGGMEGGADDGLFLRLITKIQSRVQQPVGSDLLLKNNSYWFTGVSTFLYNCVHPELWADEWLEEHVDVPTYVGMATVAFAYRELLPEPKVLRAPVTVEYPCVRRRSLHETLRFTTVVNTKGCRYETNIVSPVSVGYGGRTYYSYVVDNHLAEWPIYWYGKEDM